MPNILFPHLDLGHSSIAAANGEASEPIRVTAVRHPFQAERILIELPAGGSVADMLRAIGLSPAIPARVFVNDHIVTFDERGRIYPKPGQTLTVRAVPRGGGNSKDAEILTIVVAAVAAIATYGASAGASAFLASTPTVSGTAAAGGTAATGAAAGGAAAAQASTYTLLGAIGQGLQAALIAAIRFGGAQLINSLIPPPKTPVPKQETTPQSYTVSGTANAAAPFAPIPKIYGARRIFPQYAASPYNELVGFNQYLRMLFLLGYGPLDISQIKIGDTALEDYEDVEWELRSGFADDAPTRLYPGSVSEAELSIQLSKTNSGGAAPTVLDWAQVPIQTSGTNADELAVVRAR